MVFTVLQTLLFLTGDPDPLPVIYRFFSLWGSAQLIFCLVCWIVIFKYKSLIPLMNVFWIIDWGQRIFIYPIIREDITSIGIYTNDITPGIDLAPYVFVTLVLMFLISVANRKEK